MFWVIDRVSALAVQKKDGVMAEWAVQVLSLVVDRCMGVLLRVGTSNVSTEEGGQGKESAGALLACVELALEKQRGKLAKVNPAYVETLEKLKENAARRDVVIEPGPIGRIVQKELVKAELYRDALRFYRRLRLLGKGRTLLVWSEVPREYWETLELGDLSEATEPEWWAFLWPMITKNNADFLVGVREYRYPTLGIRRHVRWSSYREEFHEHLQSLAEARDKAAKVSK